MAHRSQLLVSPASPRSCALDILRRKRAASLPRSARVGETRTVSSRSRARSSPTRCVVIDSRKLLAAAVFGLVAPDVFGADLRLGAAIASDYVFRGVVQTDQGIAYQATAEIESARGFYGGVWASRADYSFEERNGEGDWLACWLIRISDAFTVDAGIVRYTYDADFAGEETDWTEVQLATHVHDRWSFLVAAARGWLATDERSYVAEATYRHPLPALIVLD